MFEAGTKYLSAFSSNRVEPLDASRMRTPHSRVLTGGAENNASTRSENLRVAGSGRAFLGFSDGVVEAFVKGGREVGACENELSGNESRVKRRAHAGDKNLRGT